MRVNKKIWAIILAAGESKRMGAPKMLMPFGKSNIIEAAIKNTLQSEVGMLLVVLGAEQEKIKEKIKNYGINTVYNPDFHRGMLSSVQKGFKALPKNAQAALIILGDQPSLSYRTINRLIREFEDSDRGIVLPVFQGRRGHPVLIDMKYCEEVQKLSPEIGLRELIRQHPEDILEVNIDDSAVIQDIDTPEDYRREGNKKSS